MSLPTCWQFYDGNACSPGLSGNDRSDRHDRSDHDQRASSDQMDRSTIDLLFTPGQIGSLASNRVFDNRMAIQAEIKLHNLSTVMIGTPKFGIT